MNRSFRIILASLTILLGSGGAKGQTNVIAAPALYGEFFSETPPDLDLVTAPPAARNIIAAKVCFISPPFWGGGRHGAHPKDLLGAELQIIEVLKGETAGTRLHVSFLQNGALGKFTFPATPRQRKLNYFVVSYLDADNERRLIARPVSQERYEEWDKERWAHERERGRMGAQDEGWTSSCPDG